ncbi:MAG TPA: hypothetical protein VLJ15_05585 [Gammaproteobacteria bacterium]|nr:hypothetical protein [Gammaproteobacteria bacterium]
MKWLHRKLDDFFEPKIKMDVLSELLKYQKPDESYMNHVSVLIGRLSSWKKENVQRAINELINCGYVRRSDIVASQLYITTEGKGLFKEYNQFCNKGILDKITWWYDNRFKGVWKLLWIAPIGVLVGIVKVVTIFW